MTVLVDHPGVGGLSRSTGGYLLGLNREEFLLSMRSGEKGFPLDLGRWWSGSVEEHLWF